MDKEFGLVLAGGGTKGAYEVGVWKALKELNINITAIAGTSIGALNFTRWFWKNGRFI